MPRPDYFEAKTRLPEGQTISNAFYYRTVRLLQNQISKYHDSLQSIIVEIKIEYSKIGEQ